MALKKNPPATGSAAETEVTPTEQPAPEASEGQSEVVAPETQDPIDPPAAEATVTEVPAEQPAPADEATAEEFVEAQPAAEKSDFDVSKPALVKLNGCDQVTDPKTDVILRKDTWVEVPEISNWVLYQQSIGYLEIKQSL